MIVILFIYRKVRSTSVFFHSLIIYAIAAFVNLTNLDFYSDVYVLALHVRSVERLKFGLCHLHIVYTHGHNLICNLQGNQ